MSDFNGHYEDNGDIEDHDDHEDNDDIEDLAKIVLSLAITEKVEQHTNRVKS